MQKRGDFCFLKHTCVHCGQEIPLKKEGITHYLTAGFPRYLPNHQMIGRKRLDSSKRMKENNPMFLPEIQEKLKIANSHPRPDLKGKKRPEHSENMKKAWERRNKISKELLKPEITPEIKQILLTEQDKITIALQRLETQRLQKIKEFELESAKRPKEKSNKPKFGHIMCMIENRVLKKCPNTICKHYKYCHKDKKY